MHLAYWDTLTGLPNRAQFNDRLTEAIQVAEGADVPLSLLMIDLDRFKYVNDTLGHHIGDLLLAEVGKRMAELVPANEATVARLGGDEFAILLPRQDIAAACRIAAKLLKRLEVPITVEGQVVDVSGSIGIVSFPDNGPDANTLFRHADLAMYAAKRGNLGFAVYEVSDVERHHAERLSLMTELRQAVEHDELMLYYQPKIDLVTGSVKYVEALVRWQHPSRGMVPPDAFIPFAEQTGYIKTISRWVVARAIEQCARWQEAGIELAVSINVSARDLIHSDLPEVLAQCLELNDVAPQKVWIEITESALMEDAENAIKTLDRLHAMGLRMSIDDFGTGYSSLAYLKRMPVDEIKIDKSFVLTMDTNAEDMTIVRSTIDLGHNMGLKVVAEGVETIEVLGQLREMGCDLAQGFYLSRPLPAAGLEAWLRNWDEVTGGQAQGAEEGLKAA
jgi:diguanylate cyclase (GGDEF)-like protein